MDEFDIAVVGGGAAGAILASRLSEERSRRVILLEAGPDFSPDCTPTDIRDCFPSAYSNPDYFWPGLKSEPQKGAQPSPFLQARVIGGGSSVMGMWALRGQPEDYDSWRDAGAIGWSWDDILPSFKRLERDLNFHGPLHGECGPVPICRHPSHVWPEFVRALSASAAERGLTLLDDINGEFEDGVFPVPVTNDEGGRVSSASGYLTREVRRRSNLQIHGQTHVDRVVFAGRQAIGVEVSGGALTGVIRCNQVILAAGAIGSPTVLMRSGVGPAVQLRQLGIEPVVNLPGVGERLQNHCIVNLATRIAPFARQSRELRTYALACARLSSGQLGSRRGDLHLQFITKTSLNPHGDKVGIVGAALYAPLSRGRVSLRSRSSADLPRIEFCLLDHSSDRERLGICVEFAMRLLSTTAIREMRDSVFAIIPSSIVRRLNRPDTLNRALSLCLAFALDLSRPVRNIVSARAGAIIPEVELASGSAERLLTYVSPIYHPTGTCAMGREDDPLAVLDPSCKVRGIEGLRVADASIMPTIPTANTCLPTMMIAEHISRKIAAN